MRLGTGLSWFARGLGLISAGLLLAFMFGGNEHFRPTANEALGLLFFPFGVIVGFAVAWWREGLGGLITVASLGLFYCWLYARDGALPASPYFLLFAAPGFLHLAAALLRRNTNRSGDLTSLSPPASP